MLDFLLSYSTLTVASLVFLGSLLGMVLGRNKLSPTAKGALWGLVCILGIYLAFILIMTLAAGSNPPQEPVPMPAA